MDRNANRIANGHWYAEMRLTDRGDVYDVRSRDVGGPVPRWMKAMVRTKNRSARRIEAEWQTRQSEATGPDPDADWLMREPDTCPTCRGECDGLGLWDELGAVGDALEELRCIRAYWSREVVMRAAFGLP